MFGNKDSNEKYYEGIGRGNAEAFAKINDIIEKHSGDDPAAVLMAVKIICEYELRDNPYIRKVRFYNQQVREV